MIEFRARRWTRRGGTVACLAVVALNLMLSAAPANAYRTLGCRWVVSNIKYYNAQNSTLVDAAANPDWSSRVSDAKFVKVTRRADRNLEAKVANVGNVGWSGIMRKPGTSSGAGCTSSGYWITKEMEIVLNTYYNPTAKNRRGVLVHEFGHAFGLDHNDATYSGCPNGSTGYRAIMYSSDDRFVGSCAIFVPQRDDIDGVKSLY